MTKYIVVEIQSFADGGMATPSYSYSDLNSAEAKYHSVLAVAAKSSVLKHACILMTDEGFPLRHECYTHEVETTTEE